MKPWSVLVPLLLLALPAAPVQAQEGGRTIAVPIQLHELPYGFHIAPERVDARVGDTLNVEVFNLGNTTHDLVICARAGQAPCSEYMASTGPIPKGESRTLTLNPSSPGTFTYYSSFPGRLQGGMKGELIVAGEANESPAPGLVPLVAALAALALMLRRR